MARIKKRLGIGVAKPVETAAANVPLSHDEVTYRAGASPSAQAPLAHDEVTYRAEASPSAEAPLAEDEGEK